eukprot:c39319_g1_i1.p1 GENE.c39319_g1_i1~~c39319_g1_i1.p1  ORF type:complete len:174 (+),score=40.62 c39319_g1_i1:1-522(+)
MALTSQASLTSLAPSASTASVGGIKRPKKNTPTEIQHTYRIFDIEGNSRVPKAAFVDMVRILGHVISNEEARTLLGGANVADTVSEEQFKALMATYFETGTLSIPNADIFEELKIFDQGDYMCDRKEFKRICSEYAEPLDAQQIDALIKQFDPNDEGKMSFKAMVETLGASRT